MLVFFVAVLVKFWMVASSFHFVVVGKKGLIMTRKLLGYLTDVCMAVSLDCAGEILGREYSWLL